MYESNKINYKLSKETITSNINNISIIFEKLFQIYCTSCS